MCCIFTCCGWVIDLVQRCWTFTMACVIASAVCCAIITACMSGVALGYNYSLAEYIDLKETNVSVYLKRGVFDDDIVDDMEWRRSGHLPVSGHIRDDNLITASPEESEITDWRRAGRRMDDSIFEADDQHKFEGSLMKLTAKPLDFRPSTEHTPDQLFDEAMTDYTRGSLDQLKAVKAVLNSRRLNSPRYSSNSRRNNPQSATEIIDERYLPQLPDPDMIPQSVRRMMPDSKLMRNSKGEEVGPGDSLRLAVPDGGIGEAVKWFNPKLPPEKRVTFYTGYGMEEDAATYPAPVTPRPGPLRPSRLPPPRTSPTTPNAMEPTNTMKKAIDDIIDDDADSFKQKLMLDEPLRSEEFLNKMKNSLKKKPDMEEYDDDIKGLPVRRKRQVLERFENIIPSLDGIPIKEDILSNNLTDQSKKDFNHTTSINQTNVNNLPLENNHISYNPKDISIHAIINNHTNTNSSQVKTYNHASNDTHFEVNKVTNTSVQNFTQEKIRGDRGFLNTILSRLKQLSDKTL